MHSSRSKKLVALNQNVRRTLASSLLSLLLLTTVISGGCISCEQFFMLPGLKSCCGANGHCKTEKSRVPQTGRECKQIAFEHQRSFDLDIHWPLTAVVRLNVLPSMAEPFAGWSRQHLIEPSPPDRQSLYSTFLI